MAFGRKFVSSMIPKGLSPEDEEFLRRQMFSQMGNALMANAFSGGDWRGIGSAIAPMSNMPDQAMKLMRFRQEEAEQARRDEMARLTMEHSIAGEKRAVADQGIAEDRRGEEVEDRALATKDRLRSAFFGAEEQEHGGLAQEKAIQEAEAYIANNEKRLGTAIGPARAAIDVLRSAPPQEVSRSFVNQWKAKFYPEVEDEAMNQREFGLRERTQGRLEQAEDRLQASADSRNISVVKGDGFVTTFNKVTGELGGIVTLPDGSQAEIPASILRIAEERAKMEIAGTSTVTPKWTPAMTERIGRRAGEIARELMAGSGRGSVDNSELRPEDAFSMVPPEFRP